MRLLSTKKIGIAENFDPADGIKYTQFVIQFLPLEGTEEEGCFFLDSGVMGIYLGCSFATDFELQNEPTFLIDGQNYGYSRKNNIGEINPTGNQLQFVQSVDPAQQGLSSVLYAHPSIIGKNLSCTVYATQSVLDSWEGNVANTKLNDLDPAQINEAVSRVEQTITPALSPETGYNGDFTNIKNKFTEIDDLFSAADTAISDIETRVSTLETKTTGITYNDTAINGKTIITGGLNADDLFIAGEKLVIEKPFGIKWAKSGLTIPINTGTQYNIIQLLDSSLITFFANIDKTLFVLDSQGTAAAALKFPAFEGYKDYTIDFRAIGTLGGAVGNPYEWSINLTRADNTLVEGISVVKVYGRTLDKRGRIFETYTNTETDPFTVGGIKLWVDNPSAGSQNISLTGFELLIKGR